MDVSQRGIDKVCSSLFALTDNATISSLESHTASPSRGFTRRGRFAVAMFRTIRLSELRIRATGGAPFGVSPEAFPLCAEVFSVAPEEEPLYMLSLWSRFTRNRASALYVLFGSQAVSAIGSRLTSVAIGIWLYQTYGTVTPLLLVPLFQELPALLFGGWLGLAVDRRSRKAMIVLADAGQAVGTLALLLSVAGGRFELWQLYAVSALQGGFAALQGPAVGAATYQMADEAELDRVNGLRELSFPLAGVVAPALAGLLLAPIGLVGIMIVDLATFAIAAAVAALLPLPGRIERPTSPEADSRPSLWRESLQGFAFLATRRGLLALTCFTVWWNFLLNGPLELALPFLLTRTGSDAATAWLLAAMNGGALFGALLAAVGLPFRGRLAPMFGGALLAAAMFVAFGFADAPWSLGASIFLLMAPLPMFGALFASLVQLRVPEELHGRVFAAVGQLNAVAAPLSFAIVGPLADIWLEPASVAAGSPGDGMGRLLAAAGLLIAIGALLTFLRRDVRALER